MSDPAADDHEQLVVFVERELELVGQERYEEVQELATQRAALLARLPSPAPPSARSALERALMLQESVTIELLRRRELTLLQLRRIEHALRTARGYGAAVPSFSVSQFDASA